MSDNKKLHDIINALVCDMEMLRRGRDMSGEHLSREDMKRIAKTAADHANKEWAKF